MKTAEDFSAALPTRVRIFEVGARDGLQNEKASIPLATKISLIDDLAACGLKTIETGSFVSPRWIPQMADSEAIFQGINRKPGVSYTALTPNLKGFERALSAGADEVAVFAAASESFSQKNTNCSIAESLQRFEPIFEAAGRAGIPVRGYVSCVIACPYDGATSPHKVARLSRDLLDLGCYEISLGDTIGTGTPLTVMRMLEQCLALIPSHQLAVHFHDTFGQALPNILTSLQTGIATVDSSVAGLGGCPYAPGASGNVATEDLVYMLHGMGIETGIDLDQLIALSHRISRSLGRADQSQLARARAGVCSE